MIGLGRVLLKLNLLIVTLATSSFPGQTYGTTSLKSGEWVNLGENIANEVTARLADTAKGLHKSCYKHDRMGKLYPGKRVINKNAVWGYDCIGIVKSTMLAVLRDQHQEVMKQMVHDIHGAHGFSTRGDNASTGMCCPNLPIHLSSRMVRTSMMRIITNQIIVG